MKIFHKTALHLKMDSPSCSALGNPRALLGNTSLDLDIFPEHCKKKYNGKS